MTVNRYTDLVVPGLLLKSDCYLRDKSTVFVKEFDVSDRVPNVGILACMNESFI